MPTTTSISPFAQLYEAIVERIKLKATSIRYIDLDLGQLEDFTYRPQVSFPCVLVDVDEFEYSEAGNQAKQLAEGMVIIRIALAPLSPTNGLAPAAVRATALKYFEVEQEVYRALHNWQPAGCNRLLRRKAITEKRDDGLRVRIMPFAIGFEDVSASPVRQQVARPPVQVHSRLVG